MPLAVELRDAAFAYGAEPPVLDALGPSLAYALTEANPERLLSPDPVIA